MTGVKKAQAYCSGREAERWLRDLMEGDAERRANVVAHKPATGDCDLSFCMHYDEDRRRCHRRRCFYDCDHDDSLNAVRSWHNTG